MPSTSLPPRLDVYDPAFLDDPYPTYAEVRRAGPLCRFGPAQWGVTRYDDVRALLHDPRLSSAFPEDYHRVVGGAGPTSDFFRRVVLFTDPPRHTALRSLLRRCLAGEVRRLGPRLVERTDALLSAGLDAGALDAVADLSAPLSLDLLCEVVGIPHGDRPFVHQAAVALGRAFLFLVPEHERAEVDEAVVTLRAYIADLLEQRRRRPGDDYVTHLVRGADDQGIDRADLVDNTVFLFPAGSEAALNMVATSCALLAGDPGAWTQLSADRGLVPTAVEELLRYEAVIQTTPRLVRSPLQVGGRHLRPGRVLVLMLGCANHDERRFPDPERLDLRRRPNPHLSFSSGGHHCLGNALARLESTVVLERLRRRCRSFEAAAPAVRRAHPNFRSFVSVPVALRPR